jgi:hypothetical protein
MNRITQFVRNVSTGDTVFTTGVDNRWMITGTVYKYIEYHQWKGNDHAPAYSTYYRKRGRT